MLSMLSASAFEATHGKRKRSDSEGSDILDAGTSLQHKLLILESEDSCPTFEDSESCCSFQERETDVPRDNQCSDTSVEYTLCSNSESEKGSTSSGSSEINTKKIDTIIIIEDIGLLGGSSDSDCDQDSELPKADFWSCKCGAKKNNPRFGTCQKCFKARTSFLPTRPRRKMRRRNEKKSSRLEMNDPCTSGPTTSSQLSSGVDNRQVSEGYSSQSSSQASLSKALMSQASLSQASLSQASLSQDSLLEASTSSLSQLSQLSDGNKCSVCLDQPIDGIFVHGNSGHDYACYRCSVRIYKDKKRCPICNRAVNNVIRLYKSSLPQ